ncbi:MAG: CHAD domain-containing protein [Acetobacteraceae bacterium]
MSGAGMAPPAPTPPRLHLPGDLPAGAALHQLLAAAVAELRADLPLALAGEAEAVHRMRATLRRMRAVLALFAPVLPIAAAPRARTLRRLGRALGPARDWDVLVEETLPRAEAAGMAPITLAALHRAALMERRLAYARMRRTLGGPALTRALAGLLAWSEPLAGRGRGILAQPVSLLAPGLLARLARGLRAGGKAIDSGDPEALHKLRRRTRRLRDAAEALGDAAPTRLVKAARRLSEQLGRANDAATAAALATRLARPRAAGPVPAAALSDWALTAEREARRGLRRHWRKLRDA